MFVATTDLLSVARLLPFQWAHLPHSTGRLPPFAATHSCAGRQKVTVVASRGRVVSLCSPRRRYWQSYQLAMNHAGT